MGVDLNKMRKALAKREIVTKMNDPDNWISTGSAVLNYRLSGRLDVGIPNRRTFLFWGESGTGKTFLTSNAVLDAQRKGYTVIYLDSEDSISEDYMTKIGMSLDEDMFLPVSINTIEEATEALSDIFSIMEPDSKFILVIDSLAGMLSEKESNEFDKGISKGDMGQFSKKLKLFVKNINKKISRYDAFCLMVTHAYQNQDVLNGEGRWICTGGKGFQFFPSMGVKLEKAKLKDGGEVAPGVRIKYEVTKTRFTAPFQKGELHVPYNTGLDFNDGILDVLESTGIVKKNGGWYNYEADGEVVKFQASRLDEHIEILLQRFDDEFSSNQLVESSEHFDDDVIE